MAIGGFNGTDPSPTLAQFQEYVADGEIHYFIASGGAAAGAAGWARAAAPARRSRPGSRDFTATTVDGVTLYDLSGGIQ